jgi:glycosyltransferase involved in cell wall biosynthesis
MRLSVVVPVYRSADTLRALYDHIVTQMPSSVEAFEIVFVDDGDDDLSWAQIKTIAQQDDRVRGLRLARNFGQHNALLAAVRVAQYEYTLTMDDDLQTACPNSVSCLTRFHPAKTWCTVYR